MAPLNAEYTRGRVAQYLHDRGYPVRDIPESGVSVDGYSVFLRDENGKCIIDSERSEMKTEDHPWLDPEHWLGVQRIMKGEW
jgi:hypothetical protein